MQCCEPFDLVCDAHDLVACGLLLPSPQPTVERQVGEPRDLGNRGAHLGRALGVHLAGGAFTRPRVRNDERAILRALRSKAAEDAEGQGRQKLRHRNLVTVHAEASD